LYFLFSAPAEQTQSGEAGGEQQQSVLATSDL
jgi:hypothetical protein